MHGISVADLRRQRGIMQMELAHRVGIRSETLSRIEAGFQVPSYGTARAIAEELGLLNDFEPVKASHYEYFHALGQTRAYMNYSFYAAKDYLVNAGIECDTKCIFWKELNRRG